MTAVAAVNPSRFPRALVADASADMRELYGAVLEGLVAEFVYAEDGRDALVKALASPPSLVITEAKLTLIDGYELCVLLRRDAMTRDVPIVMVTADALPAARHRADRAGVDLVLAKPCLPETLREEIHRLALQSDALRERSRIARQRIPEQMAKSDALIERSRAPRHTLKHTHDRGDTITPPLAPPTLVCPTCDSPLHYQRSHIGGVSAQNAEQWDYYACPSGCGTYQHRQRTRKLRRV